MIYLYSIIEGLFFTDFFSHSHPLNLTHVNTLNNNNVSFTIPNITDKIIKTAVLLILI